MVSLAAAAQISIGVHFVSCPYIHTAALEKSRHLISWQPWMPSEPSSIAFVLDVIYLYSKDKAITWIPARICMYVCTHKGITSRADRSVCKAVLRCQHNHLRQRGEYSHRIASRSVPWRAAFISSEACEPDPGHHPMAEAGPRNGPGSSSGMASFPCER